MVGTGKGNNNGVHYPLMDDAGQLQAASGRSAADVTLAQLSDLSPEDLRISGDTLRAQAKVAAQSGFSQLAENLIRAAELTVVPNEELLMMYEKMRPGRATLEEMTTMADRLEHEFGAVVTAAMVREAASVYTERKLLKR